MRITITGKNVEITEGLRAAVEDRLAKLEKYFTAETEVLVTLSVEKDRKKIEVTIPLKHKIIRSEQVSNDMYVSIDLVEEVIERQLKKYKNKMELNFTYNSLDINSFKLDDIFKILPSRDIIQNREEFGLINTGFQHIFKKNIIDIKCIFKSIINENDYEEFSNIFKDYNYLIIVIITKDKKRFGAFFENIDNTLYFSNGTIFDSSSLEKDYFVFSLNELNIFYCNNQENGNNPQFSIFYDINRQCLFGQENSNTYQFKLSGKEEFNIKDFELYNVKIGKL